MSLIIMILLKSETFCIFHSYLYLNRYKKRENIALCIRKWALNEFLKRKLLSTGMEWSLGREAEVHCGNGFDFRSRP